MGNEDDPYRLKELEARTRRALAMGGADKVERRRARGMLSLRERIDYLVDEGAFDELGLLAHSDIPGEEEATAADGKLTGYARIDGRTVFVSGEDYTVKAGAGGRVGVNKAFKGAEAAYRRGYPHVHLGEGGGARLPDIMGSDGLMTMTYSIKEEARDRRVPMIAAIMGECYGGPTWWASIADVVIQVKGSTMAVASPRILEIATRESATLEELGGWELHARKTGEADLFAEDDRHCLDLVRRVLGYLPNNFEETPPATACDDPEERRVEEAMQIVPVKPRMGYDMHRLVEAVFDRGSVLELKPYYDGSLITALARLGGRVVGVLANNPLINAGAMGPGACEKGTAFLCLCDSFHIPLVFLHDTPGFLVGRTAEEGKMPLKIMTFISALQKSTVPRVGVIVRKSYGMAHCNMSGGGMGSDRLLAWPIADVSFMAPDVAVNVAYARKIEEAADPEAERRAYLEQVTRASEPWRAAGLGLIDRIIDPADTRRELARALRISRGPSGEGGRSRRLLAGWPRMF